MDTPYVLSYAISLGSIIIGSIGIHQTSKPLDPLGNYGAFLIGLHFFCV